MYAGNLKCKQTDLTKKSYSLKMSAVTVNEKSWLVLHEPHCFPSDLRAPSQLCSIKGMRPIIH